MKRILRCLFLLAWLSMRHTIWLATRRLYPPRLDPTLLAMKPHTDQTLYCDGYSWRYKQGQWVPTDRIKYGIWGMM